MPTSNQRLQGVYRFSSIARPVDPKFATNRALLFVLPALALVSAVLAWAYGIGGEPVQAGVNALLVGFGAWALTRELAPDDNAAAFVALAGGWLMSIGAGASSVLLLFITLLLVRIVNRSTGLRARLFDSASVVGLSVWGAHSLQQPLILPVAALAFGMDAYLRDGVRIHYAAAAVCLAAFIWLLATGATVLGDAVTRTDWLALLLLALFVGTAAVWSGPPVSVGDAFGYRLATARVRAGQLIGLLCGAQLVAAMGQHAWAASPIWACLVAVPVSALVNGLQNRLQP